MDTETPLHELLLERERQSPYFLTYTARPKAVERIQTHSDLSPDGQENTAILLSGPMVYEDHFTRDTIRLYRKHYPKALIILSTWDDEDHAYLDDLREDRVLIVISTKPHKNGLNNTELARIPIHAGLCNAKQHNIPFVFRTVTLQRHYAPNILAFLHGISEQFPLKMAGTQKSRIIASSQATRKHLPFCISTIFMYGHIDDLLTYWDDSEDTRKAPPTATEEPGTLRMQIEQQFGCYFATRFLDKTGASYKPDCIQDHWRILAERFCLLDRDMLDIYWYMPAGTPRHAAERPQSPYTARNTLTMTFSDWLILYHTLGHHPPAPEWILDMPWGETLPPRRPVAYSARCGVKHAG